jgi:hypothetical protein
MSKVNERRIKTKNNEVGKLLSRGRKHSRVLIDGDKEDKLIPTDSYEVLETNVDFSLKDEGSANSESNETVELL